jgi:hypothetical protein
MAQKESLDFEACYAKYVQLGALLEPVKEAKS